MIRYEEAGSFDLARWRLVWEGRPRRFRRMVARLSARQQLALFHAALRARLVGMADACDRVMHPLDPWTGRRGNR